MFLKRALTPLGAFFYSITFAAGAGALVTAPGPELSPSDLTKAETSCDYHLPAGWRRCRDAITNFNSEFDVNLDMAKEWDMDENGGAPSRFFAHIAATTFSTFFRKGGILSPHDKPFIIC